MSEDYTLSLSVYSWSLLWEVSLAFSTGVIYLTLTQCFAQIINPMDKRGSSGTKKLQTVNHRKIAKQRMELMDSETI